jgi:hypothetical protein
MDSGVFVFQSLIGLASLVFGIFCIIDVTKHSDAAFEAGGMPKQTALILTIVGTLCCLFVNLYYWFAVRPKVVAAEQGGGYPPAV